MTIKVTRKSMVTGKFHTLELDITQEQLTLYYEEGALLQDAFPNLPAPEREFIKTGITPEEWLRFVIGDNEDDLEEAEQP